MMVLMSDIQKDKLDRVVRWTISIPLPLSIKIDIERKKSNDTKSSWIRKCLEKELLNSNNIIDPEIKRLSDELEQLKSKIK